MLQLTRINFQTLHRNFAKLDVCYPELGEVLNFSEQIAKRLLRSPFWCSLQPPEVRRAILVFLEYRRLPRKPFFGRYPCRREGRYSLACTGWSFLWRLHSMSKPTTLQRIAKLCFSFHATFKFPVNFLNTSKSGPTRVRCHSALNNSGLW